MTSPLDCMYYAIEYGKAFRVPMEDMEVTSLSIDCLDLGNQCIDDVGTFGLPFGLYVVWH